MRRISSTDAQTAIPGAREHLISPRRAEIMRAIPPGSRRIRSPRIEAIYLEAIDHHPAALELRPDARANLIAVARTLARHASYSDGTTRPTRARICRSARIGLTAWKAARRRLERWGFLGTVSPGTTPALHGPAALVDLDAANDAAVYVLCVPLRAFRHPIAQLSLQTRPPTWSSDVQEGETTRARQDQKPRRQGRAPATAARELQLGAGLRIGPARNLTDGWLAWLARPFARAGWTGADLEHARDYHPDGSAWTYGYSADPPRRRFAGRRWITTGDIRSPARWLAWRLAHWLGPDGIPVASPSQLAAAERTAALASAAALRAERAAAAAAATPPTPAFRAARAALAASVLPGNSPAWKGHA